MEFFHAVTDGGGGMVFLQNLTAQYLRLKYGVSIAPEGRIVALADRASAAEIVPALRQYLARKFFI